MLTILGIAMGVSMIFAIEMSRISTIGSFGEMIDDMAGKASLQVTSESNSGFDEKLVAEIGKVPGVKIAAPSIVRMVMLQQSGENKPLPLQLLAIDPDVDRRVRTYKVTKGRWLEQKNDVLLNAGFARQNSIRPGDDLQLMMPGRPVVKVAGLLGDRGVGQTAQGMVAVMPIALAQETYRLEGEITAIDIVSDPGEKLSTLKKAVNKRLDDGLSAKTPKSRGQAINNMIDFVTESLASLSILVLLAGAFVVNGTLRMSVAEQTRQIGIARAIGASRRQVFIAVGLQGLIVGVLGSVLGLLLGYGATGAFIEMLEKTLELAPSSVAAVAGPAARAASIGLGMTMLATVIPAMSAMRATPLSAFRVSARQPVRWFETWPVAGLTIILMIGVMVLADPQTVRGYNMQMVILVLGVAAASPWLVRVLGEPLGKLARPIFGPAGLLAGRNLARNRMLSATALATIVLSLTITISMGELAATDRQFYSRMVQTVLPYDLMVGQPPFTALGTNMRPPMSPEETKKITEIEGVKGVQTVRFLSTRGLKTNLYGIFIDPDDMPPRGNQPNEKSMAEAAVDLKKGGHVILGSAIAQKRGVKAGESIMLSTPKGRRRFKVSATIHHPANTGEVVMISRGDQRRFWDDTGVDFWGVWMEPGADIEAVRTRLIDDIGKPNNVTVVSYEEERKEVMAAINGFLATFDAMVFLAAVISAMAVIIVQMMNVLSRQRELGVMRAIGSSRALLQRAIILEAIMMGLIALGVGLAIGIPLTHSVVEMGRAVTGFTLVYITPIQPVASAIFIAIGVTFLASLWPARRGAGIKIVTALKEE